MSPARDARRRLRRKHRRVRPGAPPGTLVPEPGAPRPAMEVIAYDGQHLHERAIRDPAEVRGLLEEWPVTWLNVDGLGDTVTITDIGEVFGFHRLALEDVVETHQRAKVESYDGYYFIVVRMPIPGDACDVEQMSIFFGPKYVVTFQERPGGDCLNPVRLRLRAGSGRLRAGGTDYLVYALLDVIIDQYFPHVERCGEQLDALEEQLYAARAHDLMAGLHDVKRDLLVLHRSIWPLRDALSNLLRAEAGMLTAETRVYLRDCYDHVIQLLDLVDTYRELAASLSDLNLSIVSYRTNEIVRVLTVISTIFMPLTFLAGVYGMNFDTSSPFNMPELGWYFGYPLVILVMACTAAAQLLFFRRLGWLGTPRGAALRGRSNQQP